MNFWNEKSIWQSESIILITSFLFADSLTLGGEPALALQLNKLSGKLTTLQKINFIYSYTKTGLPGYDDIDIGGYIEKYYGFVNSSRNNLSSNRKLFIDTKKLEGAMIKFYETIRKIYESEIIETMYTQLRIMSETYPVHTALEQYCRIGVSNKKINPTKEAEKILDFIFPRKTSGQPSILMLYLSVHLTTFLQKEDQMKNRTSEGLPEFIVPETVESYCQLFDEMPDLYESWLPQMISVPAINHLNHLELLQIKKDLKTQIDAFNACANNWIECSMQLEKEKEALASSHLALLKSSSLLEAAMKQHPLCNTLEKNTPGILVYTGIYFYHLNLAYLWHYFEQRNLLQSETITALRNITKDNPSYPSIIPVIGISVNEDPTKNWIRELQDQNATVEVIGRKKSIDFD